MQVERLNWDSDFFKMRIGKIVCNGNVIPYSLKTMLEKAATDYDLLYVFAKCELDCKPFFGDLKLVDKKVVYSGAVNCYSEEYKTTREVEFYKAKQVNEELEKLAWISAGHSRYKTDSNFGATAYKKLYSEWIKNSINGKLADKVVCHKTNDIIDGFLTFKCYGSVADIGLVAVSENCQGLGIGSSIMKFTKKSLINMGIEKITVATQQDNIQACRFYEKQGFLPSKPVYVYHYWSQLTDKA